MSGTSGSAVHCILYPCWINFTERFHTTTSINHPNGTIEPVRLLDAESDLTNVVSSHAALLVGMDI